MKKIGILLRRLTFIVLTGTIIGALSGCSLAVDSGNDISIPVRKSGFQAQDGPTTERLKDVVEEYHSSF